MRYSAWQSLKESWATMLWWQRAFIVLTFPLTYLCLVGIAWGMNRNGHNDSSQTSSQT